MPGTVTNPAFTSLTNSGFVNAQFRSLYDFEQFPKFYEKVVNKYGNLFGLNSFLNIMGQRKTISNQQYQLFERDADTRPIVTGADIATTSAGADATVTLAASQYDSNSANAYLRVNDSVILPAQFFSGSTSPKEYQVVSTSGSGTSTTYTLRPFDETASITTAIPSGTELMLGANKWAPGTRQPVGKTKGSRQRTFDLTLVKESFGQEGGQNAVERWFDTSYVSGVEGTLYSEGVMRAEMDLDRQCDATMLFSELNTNDNLVQTSVFGGSNKVLSGKGLWNWMDELAIKFVYDDHLVSNDFYTFRQSFESQGVEAKEVDFFVGAGFMDSLERDTGLVFNKEFSGGNSYRVMENGEIDLTFPSITVGGVKYNFIKIDSFSDQTRWNVGGFDEYWYNAGFMAPRQRNETEAAGTIAGVSGDTTEFLPNMCLGEVNYGGENRSRIIANRAGMNGFGLPVTDDFDGMYTYLLKHFMLIVTQVNQFIQFRKQ